MSHTLTARAIVLEQRWGQTTSVLGQKPCRYEDLMLDLDLSDGLSGTVTVHVDDPAWATSFPAGTILTLTVTVQNRGDAR